MYNLSSYKAKMGGGEKWRYTVSIVLLRDYDENNVNRFVNVYKKSSSDFFE